MKCKALESLFHENENGEKLIRAKEFMNNVTKLLAYQKAFQSLILARGTVSSTSVLQNHFYIELR